ncbi:putative sugar kinase YdjH [Symmachiella dynata]|uniref:carbohydrate kinase family protein n=1 Tax=Symmachiella dynata TaxID=2527995 RepID=UPI00118ACBFA|nr:carbohydrate kinase family protein [Symmachiella dynata]QDT47997.1 putative sugar kinase YdjH [Symmachiella dynata]
MAEYRYDCLCVGIVVADHACTPIPSLPAAGHLQMADRLQLSTGGCAANVAVDLAKLGLRVAIVGRVGDDVFGGFVSESLTAAGVETQYLMETPNTETSGTLIVNVAGEDRRFVHAFGANAVFDGTEVTDELLASAPILYLGGYLLMPGLTAEAVADLFRRAQAAGVKTVLDVAIAPAAELWERIAAVLPYTDLFFPNEDEARLMTGLENARDQAERFREAGARTVVITRGETGTVLAGDGELIEGGVFPVSFVDGTGSGDAFDAGFVLGMLEGRSNAECLRLGSALGASCVRQIGATAGVFTRPELDAFLREHELPLD